MNGLLKFIMHSSLCYHQYIQWPIIGIKHAIKGRINLFSFFRFCEQNLLHRIERIYKNLSILHKTQQFFSQGPTNFCKTEEGWQILNLGTGEDKNGTLWCLKNNWLSIIQVHVQHTLCPIIIFLRYYFIVSFSSSAQETQRLKRCSLICVTMESLAALV